MTERIRSALPSVGAALPLLFLAACSLPWATTKTPAPPPPISGPSQTGIASWYGPGFHGRLTASGTVYDQHDLTAAHQTLPLGTQAMVTNLDNGKTVAVTINDRGPFAKGRVIDLSYAAAQTLGMIGPGTAPVRIDVIDGTPLGLETIPHRLDYTLQIGSFTEIDNANKLKEQLSRSYPGVAVVPLQGKDATYYRVQLGTFSSRQDAERHARRLARGGFSVVIMEK